LDDGIRNKHLQFIACNGSKAAKEKGRSGLIDNTVKWIKKWNASFQSLHTATLDSQLPGKRDA
jgi:hypothetical protein